MSMHCVEQDFLLQAAFQRAGLLPIGEYAEPGLSLVEIVRTAGYGADEETTQSTVSLCNGQSDRARRLSLDIILDNAGVSEDKFRTLVDALERSGYVFKTTSSARISPEMAAGKLINAGVHPV